MTKTKEVMHDIYELNQEELYQFIKDYLNAKNVPFIEFDGNIYSLRFENKVSFVSHLDTVALNDNEYHKPVFEYCGILFKRRAILGADDRAGVNIILNHCEDINFVLTRDEEIGRLGAKSLRDNEEFVQAVTDNNIVGFIEMDRRNNKDILGKKHGYCNEDFHNAIFEVLGDRVDAIGSVTDVDSFIDLKPAVNLSVGYHNPHTENEFLDIEAWLDLNNSISELNKISGVFSLPEKQKYNYYSIPSKYSQRNFEEVDRIWYGYGSTITFSTVTDYMRPSLEEDFKFGLELYVENGLYEKPYKDSKTDDMCNLMKRSSTYMECADCGKKIETGERYHVISGEIYHDKCLSRTEKQMLGILKFDD